MWEVDFDGSAEHSTRVLSVDGASVDRFMTTEAIGLWLCLLPPAHVSLQHDVLHLATNTILFLQSRSCSVESGPSIVLSNPSRQPHLTAETRIAHREHTTNLA
eukprot:scaffold100934_cov34-Tisochrysis_lutea.AAC.4